MERAWNVLWERPCIKKRSNTRQDVPGAGALSLKLTLRFFFSGDMHVSEKKKQLKALLWRQMIKVFEVFCGFLLGAFTS